MKIHELTVSERILLAEELWDSVVNEDTGLELTEAQRLELDSRLIAFEKDRELGSHWQDVKNRIISGK
jgi:putative addiction module component (TIGR02574 family)